MGTRAESTKAQKARLKFKMFSADDKGEKYWKDIEKISKGSKIKPADFTNPTEEQQQAVDEQDKRFGFVKFNQIEDEKSKPEPETPKMVSMEEWRTKKLMKALIGIQREKWASVRYFAILNNCSIDKAVDRLLSLGLQADGLTFLQRSIENEYNSIVLHGSKVDRINFEGHVTNYGLEILKIINKFLQSFKLELTMDEENDASISID